MGYKEKEEEKRNREGYGREANYAEYRKTSAAFMRVRQAGKGEFSGYVPSEQERKTKNQPEEVQRMENGFGRISFGRNRKKEMVMTISGKGNQQPVLPNDTKWLEAQSAVRLNQLPDRFYTNSHDRTESALAYKVSYQTSPVVMMRRLKNMQNRQDVYMGKNILPFFREKEMKAQKEKLDALLHAYTQEGDRNSVEMVQQALAEHEENRIHREREEKRFRQQLERAVEMMRKESKTNDSWHLHGFQENFFSQTDDANGNPDETQEGEPTGKPAEDLPENQGNSADGMEENQEQGPLDFS